MKRQLIFRTLVLCLLFASALLAACGKVETVPPTPNLQPSPTSETLLPTEAAQPTSPPEAPKIAASQKVSFSWVKEFESLSPLYANQWEAAFTHQLWNCWAWDFDNTNSPHPVLVQEIPSLSNGGLSADGSVITMKLREGITWSDGTPITAQDFVFTYEMFISPNNNVVSRTPYDNIARIDAPDAVTVVITFNQPYAPWLSALWHGLLPEHILRPVYEASGTLDQAEWNRAPAVGCGPFVFAEWQPGALARFTANASYWMGRPKLDEITLRFTPDNAAQINSLRSGETQLGTRLSYTELSDLASAGIRVAQIYSGFNEGWFFNLDDVGGHPALQDQNVRQAIALAIDRNTLIQNLLQGQTKPAAGYWDNTPYIDPALQPWPYDPERAKQLLDAAGWTDTNADGTRDKDEEELIFIFGTTTGQLRAEAVALAAQQLAAVGIRLEITTYPADEFFRGYSEGGPAATGQFDIFEYSAGSKFPDPDTADFLCEQIPSPDIPNGLNWNNFCDLELNDLFKLQTTQMDFQARQQTFYKISRMVYERVYFMGLWQDPDLWGLSPRLMDVQLSGVTPFYNVISWYLVE